MKSLIRLFSHNWGLKLLALVLAIVVYYTLRDSDRTDGAERSLFMKGTESRGAVRN